MRTIGVLVALALVLSMSAGAVGGEGEYKKFTRNAGEKTAVELIISADDWRFTVFIDDMEDIYTYPAGDVIHDGQTIRCGDDVVIDENGMTIGDYYLSNSDIVRIDVEPGVEAGKTVLSYMIADNGESDKRFRKKKGDKVSIFGKVTVGADEFIRGSVISFFGDIDVRGEVNEDVVAITGDIVIEKDAVVRGDVIAAAGEIKMDRGASVYGNVQSGDETKYSRRHRARKWKEYRNEFDVSGTMAYNRVDGLSLLAGFDYEDSDSLLPSFNAMGGYAFSSERWRYTISLSQTIFRGPVPLAVGGEVFRLLKSDDEKIIGELENSTFALLVNEDWKDYYEAEGAYGFARMKILDWNTLEIGYLTEQQQWMDAHPKLWSVFGKKDFRGNFSSVPYDTLRHRRSIFDDQHVASLVLKYTLDTRDDDNHPRRGWHGYAAYEYSPEDWQGDFDFKRFEMRLKRFQPLSRYISTSITGAYGYLEGTYIPMSRMFYLGGLGTLHGYRHKEFIGTEYIMVSAEYRFHIPQSDLEPFVQYDGGRMMGDLWAGTDDWCSSLSVGIDIDRSFRLFISKRLDVSDEDPVIYARFSAVVL